MRIDGGVVFPCQLNQSERLYKYIHFIVLKGYQKIYIPKKLDKAEYKICKEIQAEELNRTLEYLCKMLRVGAGLLRIVTHAAALF